MATIPHLRIPFQVTSDGSVAVLEQDTIDDVGQCVQVLLTTVRGERDELPTYGIPDQAFVVEMDHQTILNLAAQWEPRAVVMLEGRPDLLDEMVHYMTATVRSKS